MIDPRLGVLDVVDAAAEGEPGVLTGADEVQLGPVGVAARGRVDEHAQERQLLGVDLMPPRPHRPDDLAGVDEQGQLVGIDDRPGELPDLQVGPFEDDLVFFVVGYRYELTAEQGHRAGASCVGVTHQGSAVIFAPVGS